MLKAKFILPNCPSPTFISWDNKTKNFLFPLVASNNQPKFSACATWNSESITFANSSTIGVNPTGMYVNINNTIYVADASGNRIIIWSEGSPTPTRNITGGWSSSYSIFVSVSGDIYIDNGAANHSIDVWKKNATSSVVAMNVLDRCLGLFVDMIDNLYCSYDRRHRVVKMSLRDGSNTTTTAAGTGVYGTLPDMLNGPNGIFVDKKLNLYVADYGNDRVQFFRYGQLNGTTLAGNGMSGTISLNCPSAIILDADEYLYISDSWNHRIIRSGPGGYHCLSGCNGGFGAAPYQLNRPYALSFDSYGNLFVVNNGSNRVQKFLLTTNSCGMY